MMYPSWYGAWIAIGICVVMTCLRKDRLFVQRMTSDQTFDLAFYVLLAAIVGGRLLFIIDYWRVFESWGAVFNLTVPGFSVLGSVVAAIATLFWYLKKYTLDFYGVVDRIALYAPLLHACGRIGCFCVGCCHGISCDYPWSVVYAKASSLAPIGAALHPTQLYSAACFLLLFCILFFIDRSDHWRIIPGFLITVYVFGLGLERFFIDFLRDDRILVSWVQALSTSQICALLCMFYALVHAVYLFERQNDG